jgi:Domain of unknown function (DUF1707)
VPVTARQDDAMGAAAGRRPGASRADREHVIDTLKAAFVQGRLTKDELDSRVGQALTTPACADLAVLTGDLPAGLAPPHQAASRRAWPPLGKAVVVAMAVLAPVAVLVAALVTRNEHLGRVFLLLMPWYFIAWIVAGLQMLEPLRKRSDGQLTHRPARRGFGKVAASRERAC